MIKNKMLKAILSVSLAAAALVTASQAKGFTKTNTYTDGQFADVKSTAWYASDVKSAYELGFVNGKSDTLYVPEGNVTVAEGITMATCVHSIYNGKTIAEKTGGKWYDMYVEYAKANGLIEENQYTNYDRNIMRYEMALLFANAMPESYFTPKNDIKDIPDVAETEDYYDELMMLYRAGVVLGSDDYGNFYATNSIKRSETSAIINRVALPENRVSGTLKEYGNREQAVYLIDDMTMVRTVRGTTMVASGWRYENMGTMVVSTEEKTSNSISDVSDKARTALHRDVTVQTKGIVKVESAFTASSDNGAEVIFTDSEGTDLFKLCITDGKYVAFGDKEQATNTAVSEYTKLKKLYFELDLDKDEATVVADGKNIGTFSMNKSAKDLARMSYATTKEDKLALTASKTKMYVNYDVNDSFFYSNLGETPWGWNVSGKTTVENIKSSDYDTNSVKLDGAGSASKKFAPVNGKFVYETFLLPTKQGKGYVALKNGANDALKIEFDAQKFTCNGKLLREFDARSWQSVRIEGDTEADKAVIKLNNKVFATVDLSADAVDGIEIVNSGSDVLWFDDVELYNVYDYADYVAKPVPVTDDEWLVGMSVCSLWREGSHYGWDCISPYDEITPVLGYYDEGLPEVADWEIKFFVEHGYDFQHYCWYLGALGSEPIKDTRLSDAITNGFMNAKYSDMMDMMIMWENQSCTYSNPDFFYNYVWPYWCEWYFNDSRYLRIENRAPITIYSLDIFVKNMGGMESAKQAVAFMNEDIKRLGYDGVVLFGCPTFNGYTEEMMNKAKELSFEGLLSYTFGEFAYDAQYQKDAMMKAYNMNGVPLVPAIGVGFNDIGWTEERAPLATVEAHREVMEWSKDTYIPLIAERAENSWISKMVFHTTWNEYGEGHYIMPSNLNKFGYVDCNRAVFSSVAGKDDKAHFDVEPTDNQKARLGYLYPAKSVPMKRERFMQDAGSDIEYQPVKIWNFENQKDVLSWSKMNQCKDIYFDEQEKALVGETTGTDGNIKTVNTGVALFNADEATKLHLSIKLEATQPTQVQLYFVNRANETWSADKGIFSNVIADGEYHDYYIDLTKNTFWKGDITGVRFDPAQYACKFYIKCFEFLTDKEIGSYTLNVDGTEFPIGKNFIEKLDNEYLIAAEPKLGFYSGLNLYYEYNRVNGTLDVFGNNGSKMHLEVGSDKVIVDGKTVTVAKPIYKVDGIVTVPFKLLCETFGYKLEENEYELKVTVREDEVISTEKVENSFEFNIPGDTEGFTASSATGAVLDGKYVLTATPVSYNKTGYDPQIVNKGVFINTDVYNVIEIRYRPLYSEGVDFGTDGLAVYFATTAETGLDEKKTFRSSYKSLTPDAEGFVTVRFDCNKNEKWTTNVTTLRIDPGNYGGFYEIDYIRVTPNEETKDYLAAEQEMQKKREEAVKAGLEGGPFFIENADAEDVNSRANLTTGSTTVTIVEDDLRAGNHAYKLVPASEKQTWTYFRAKTGFKAGTTYKVEFDLRIISDLDGNAGVGVTAKVNPRYTDVKNGAVTGSVDHPLNKEVVTQNTSDGWVRHSFIFTVSEASPARETDEFTVFVDPKGDKTTFTNYIAMMDNFVVTVVE